MTIERYVIDVDISSLRAVAERIATIAHGILPGPGRALAAASGPVSHDLDHAEADWIGFLTSLAEAVACLGADLHTVARDYAEAESGAHRLLAESRWRR
jgi:hypothetical protein